MIFWLIYSRIVKVENGKQDYNEDRKNEKEVSEDEVYRI